MNRRGFLGLMAAAPIAAPAMASAAMAPVAPKAGWFSPVETAGGVKWTEWPAGEWRSATDPDWIRWYQRIDGNWVEIDRDGLIDGAGI